MSCCNPQMESYWILQQNLFDQQKQKQKYKYKYKYEYKYKYACVSCCNLQIESNWILLQIFFQLLKCPGSNLPRAHLITTGSWQIGLQDPTVHQLGPTGHSQISLQPQSYISSTAYFGQTHFLDILCNLMCNIS